MVLQQHKVIQQVFPELCKWFNQIPDHRKFCQFSSANLLTQGVNLFLSGEPSRNSANNRATHGRYYKENFSRLFKGYEIAHYDTVDNFLRGLSMEDVEAVKTKMIKKLIRKKKIPTFHGNYLIVIDATGATSYDDDVKNEGLLYRKLKGGGRVYLNIILEAKIVTPDGLCYSIASEPLTNEDKEVYEKQDCELKAFRRISAKIKKLFPRLPICLLVDGLYANSTTFDICEKNNWYYIVTLKDGNLPLLQEDVIDEEAKRLRFDNTECVNRGREKIYIDAHYQSIENLKHKKHTAHWIEAFCPKLYQKEGEQQSTRFVFLTNMHLERSIRKANYRYGNSTSRQTQMENRTCLPAGRQERRI